MDEFVARRGILVLSELGIEIPSSQVTFHAAANREPASLPPQVN